MNIHMSRRLFLPAALLGGVAVFAAVFFVAPTLRSVVAGPSASPDAPNPGHEWSEVEGHGIDGVSGDYWLGTTVDQALELRVNGARALRLEPTNDTPNLIGGYSGNNVTAGAVGATIVGGGQTDRANRVTDGFGTVGGGVGNVAGDDAGLPYDQEHATVAGGGYNTAGARNATVGGGYQNTAASNNATIGGGEANTASGSFATVGGGYDNEASAGSATVGGGENNAASGNEATVGGGDHNVASGDNATVGGGSDNTASNHSATIGGGYDNEASGDNATVGGGESNTASAEHAIVSGGSWNTASGDGGTVGGGHGNQTDGFAATVGGGSSNTASGYRATVAGGYNNTATTLGWGPTVGGGRDNTASGEYATVAGGFQNTASGVVATVPGGEQNTAAGVLSFAAGYRAKANHNGSFVFGDISEFDFESAANNEFAVRATGGSRIVTAIDGTGAPTAGVKLDPGDTAWEILSDRDLKENFVVLDTQDVLNRLAGIPIAEWNYKAQDSSVRHIGPTAQDFYAAFGLSADELYISPIDTDGVALAAIQGLYEISQEQAERIDTLEARVAALEGGAAASNGSAGPLASIMPFGPLLLGALFVGGLVLVQRRRAGGRP